LRAIILAGGYAKRMWPLTKDFPKVLLPIDERPVIDHILDKLHEANIKAVIIITNLTFESHFHSWLEKKPGHSVEILAEPSRCEEEKLGAIGALATFAPKLAPDDYLVIAGDNIFTGKLGSMIQFYKKKKAPVVAVIRAGTKDEVLRGSSVILERDMRIAQFREKPDEAESMLIGVAIYLLPYQILMKTVEYIQEGGNNDALGNFMEWLCKKDRVYGYMLQGRLWDVGTIESYEQLKRELQTTNNHPKS